MEPQSVALPSPNPTPKAGKPPILASQLSVNNTDTVCWKAQTSGTNHHHILILFAKETPFQPTTSTTSALYMLTGTQADEADCTAPAGKGIGGSIYGPAGAYKYYVAVVDDDPSAKGETYTDDPQIIV